MSVQHHSVIAGGNRSILCIDAANLDAKSIWLGNPLNSPTSLLLFQLSSISIVSLLIDACLKPLGQSAMVSQIFGGMIFGPSILGYNKSIGETLFPLKGVTMMSTFAGFGVMFYLFTTGVKMDPVLMVRPGRKAAVIGIACLFVTLFSSAAFALMLKNLFTLSTSLDNSIVLIASSQCLTGFPAIASLLDELKILNTDLGRLAVSSAMFCDLLGISTMAVMFSMKDNSSAGILGSLPSILSIIAFVGSIFVLLRPRLVKMYCQTMETESVDEKGMTLIFVLVMVSSFLSEVIGQHYVFGPLVLGLAVPDGPPLGAAITQRLDTLTTTFLYPSYCALSGVQTNIFTVDLQSFIVVGIIVVFAFLIKLIAVMITALFFGAPLQEAIVLGLVLNARGIVELTTYNIWRESELIDEKVFALIMMSVVVVSVVITPMIRRMYDPAKQYASVKRSTIHHAQRETELRILVCLHSHETVPTIMNLLEASHARRDSPVAVTAMVLIELVGRSAPVLIANRSRRLVRTNSTTVGRVCNALNQYEELNHGCASVQSYTSIASFQTMHDDICLIAFEKRAHIVILPFHKQWAIDGMIGSTSRPIRNLNINVLEKAPCSVGILVDRGVLNGVVSLRLSPSKFQVAVVFIGGPDDMESLAYGCRMVKHENVHLTVIRFLLFGGEYSKDRRNDSHLINERRQENMGNERFVYVEEVLRDGEGLASYIRGAINNYHMILVGRYHPESPLLVGLDMWSECPELGVVGDMLASPDYNTTATVLVIQQQRLGGKLNHNLPFVVRNRESSVVPDDLPKKLLQDGMESDEFLISLDDFDTY